MKNKNKNIVFDILIRVWSNFFLNNNNIINAYINKVKKETFYKIHIKKFKCAFSKDGIQLVCLVD